MNIHKMDASYRTHSAGIRLTICYSQQIVLSAVKKDMFIIQNVIYALQGNRTTRQPGDPVVT